MNWLRSLALAPALVAACAVPPPPDAPAPGTTARSLAFPTGGVSGGTGVIRPPLCGPCGCFGTPLPPSLWGGWPLYVDPWGGQSGVVVAIPYDDTDELYAVYGVDRTYSSVLWYQYDAPADEVAWLEGLPGSLHHCAYITGQASAGGVPRNPPDPMRFATGCVDNSILHIAAYKCIYGDYPW
jgi:hypothetical protein